MKKAWVVVCVVWGVQMHASDEESVLSPFSPRSSSDLESGYLSPLSESEKELSDLTMSPSSPDSEDRRQLLTEVAKKATAKFLTERDMQLGVAPDLQAIVERVDDTSPELLPVRLVVARVREVVRRQRQSKWIEYDQSRSCFSKCGYCVCGCICPCYTRYDPKEPECLRLGSKLTTYLSLGSLAVLLLIGLNTLQNYL